MLPNSEKYMYHPAINVSYEQAKEYCKWRTDMLKLAYSMNTKNKKQNCLDMVDFIINNLVQALNIDNFVLTCKTIVNKNCMCL